jgi:heterodisulfide reductase subunit A-like polyferredoxin
MNQITPTPLSADRTVLVVGGGIGGLAAATAIRRTGVAVTLVERADAFGEVGAGLQLGRTRPAFCAGAACSTG